MVQASRPRKRQGFACTRREDRHHAHQAIWPMSGYAGRSEETTGVHDPLSLRVTVLKNGDTAAGPGLGRPHWLLRGRRGLPAGDLPGSACSRRALLAGIRRPAAPRRPSARTDSPTMSSTQRTYGRNAWKRWARRSRDMGPVQIGVGRGHSPVGINRRERTPDNRIKPGAIRTGRRTRKCWY